MQPLIKGGALIQNDPWTLIKAIPDEPPGDGTGMIFPLAAWEDWREHSVASQHLVGVWLDSDQDPSRLAGGLDQLALIAVHFPVFTDGRGYSYARRLREQYQYRGELRAIGDILRDQLHFLQRCGFDSFALRPDQDAEACLSAFGPFSDSYQAAADQPMPLFRRRG